MLPPGGSTSFTSGATEALNWAIKGVPAGPIVTFATEHAATLDTVEALARSGREVTIVAGGDRRADRPRRRARRHPSGNGAGGRDAGQ